MTTPLPDIIVTHEDHERISGLLSSLPEAHKVRDFLSDELDRAEVVDDDEVPPDVVTMNSRVRIEEVPAGTERTVSLVYPHSADFEAGRLSILAPVGAALLGLREGQEIDWPLPSGKRKRVRVVKVEWQPQAAGQSGE